MSRVDDVLGVLGSRQLLGAASLVLAVWALVNIDAVNDQTAEQECRDKLDAAVIVEVSESLQRIEAGLAAVAVGDEEALAASVELSDVETAAFALAITRRDNAVLICAGAG